MQLGRAYSNADECVHPLKTNHKPRMASSPPLPIRAGASAAESVQSRDFKVDDQKLGEDNLGRGLGSRSSRGCVSTTRDTQHR